MSKKFLFLITFVLLTGLASASYGVPSLMRLDMNNDTDNNDVNTEVGWVGFTMGDSGTDVCGITIDLAGVLHDARRQEPNSGPSSPGYPIWHERIYRDFIYTLPGGMEITLWGLGAGQTVDVNLYAYDYRSEPNRLCDWYVHSVLPGNLMFITEFEGMDDTQLPSEWIYASENGRYSFTDTVTADSLGRIKLIGTWNADSPRNDAFCFVNGLDVKPQGTYIPSDMAQRPVPFDETEYVAVDTVLIWKAAETADTHDVYLGTSYTAVNTATTASPEYKGNQAGTTYDPTGLLILGQTYYWRIDEVNSPVTTKGEIWSFTTETCTDIDNFDSYASSEELYTIWKDGWSNSTSSEVFREVYATTIPSMTLVHSGYSMKMVFHNNTWPDLYAYPTYSETDATIADLGFQANWTGMGAESLSLWFRGSASNDDDEPMYIKLTDGSSVSKTVQYDGEVNEITDELWKEWVIDLAEFSPVNLSNVSKITIRVGDDTQSSSDGTVYFDDITLCASRCVLRKRPGGFALTDYTPGGVTSGDCSVDYREIQTMASGWLASDLFVETRNPGTDNLVLYYPLDEGDGNKVYPAAGTGGNCGDLNKWSGTSWNGALGTPRDTASLLSTDHAPGIGGTGCAYIDGREGCKIQCGTYGQSGLGIGLNSGDANAMTVSAWIKSLGQRSWDGYLSQKAMGILGKRGGWDENTVIWSFALTANGSQLALNSFRSFCYAPPSVDAYIGQWIHVAATYPNPSGNPADANSYARLYLNGAQILSNQFRFSHGNDDNIFLAIGSTQDQNAWVNCPEGYWGYIDEVRIYNRALEANEVGYLADPTPEDGLYIPVPSAAEIYKEEDLGERIVNYRDFALLVENWLERFVWP